MIREWRKGMPAPSNTHLPTVAVGKNYGGYFVKPFYIAATRRDACPRFICDTAKEAESIRKLLESEREEIEAVRRRYEQLLTAMVTP